MKNAPFVFAPPSCLGNTSGAPGLADCTGEAAAPYSFNTRLADGRYKSWKSRSVDLKAHVVCEPCNNTWMSDVEAEAGKTMGNMITDAASVSLLPLGIKSIATFLFNPQWSLIIPGPIRAPFSPIRYENGLPSRLKFPLEFRCGLHLWANHSCGRFTTHYGKIEGGRFRGFELYIFTYVAGFIALQLTASRWASITKQPHFSPFLTQNTVWNKASIALWQIPSSPITWPPDEHLNDESLKIFGERWGKLTDGSQNT